MRIVISYVFFIVHILYHTKVIDFFLRRRQKRTLLLCSIKSRASFKRSDYLSFRHRCRLQESKTRGREKGGNLRCVITRACFWRIPRHLSTQLSHPLSTVHRAFSSERVPALKYETLGSVEDFFPPCQASTIVAMEFPWQSEVVPWIRINFSTLLINFFQRSYWEKNSYFWPQPHFYIISNDNYGQHNDAFS